MTRIENFDNDSLLKLRLPEDSSLIDLSARYHDECYTNFLIETENSTENHHRSKLSPEAQQAFDTAYQRIESSIGEPVLLSELKELMGEHFPDRRTFYKKLRLKYGDDILISQHIGRDTKIYYKNFNVPKMCSDWLCGEKLSKDQK